MATNTAWRLPSAGAGISALKKVPEAIPSPQPHQYLVRIRAVSLNFRDLAILGGATYGMPVKQDVVLGSDLAGDIVEAGKSATKYAVGDRVTAIHIPEYYYRLPDNPTSLGGPIDGTLQEYCVFDEMSLVRAPAYLTYEELCCFAVAGVTAWNALLGGGTPLRPGQTALFQGTGGVSVFGLQIAHAAGARTIITSSSDDKLELAKKLGATFLINYKKTPDWDKEVKRLTNSVGAHHVIDNVGVSEIERCFGAVTRGGTISNVGFLGGTEAPKTINTPLLALWSGSQMRGIFLGSRQHLEELLDFADVHQIHPYIHKVFEFDQLPEALEYFKSGQSFGKIVVRVGLASEK
ncbi:alcohol dehydrogenase protein [Vararia minispora EC-137]|uniref:Alcohol dehydrogenase protein n=1 Tax=Vararia minispora EC-137 TaxID=1314806 RepID=A0ACB8QCP6_9AGAM|nr:alcohol dehydrogenase protein [Vararia minispora EC-137]